TIDGLAQFDHVVISLDRKARPSKTYWQDCGPIGAARVFAYGHWGLPLGIGLFLSFFLAARRIFREVNAEDLRPDLIHAHRLTFDGLGAWLLARWWRVPFVVSVRGEVESKVFRVKLHYRPLYRRLMRDASLIYYVSLWYRDAVRRVTGVPIDKERILPNIVLNTKTVIIPQSASNGFVSVFNFAIHQKKGLTRLLPALKQAMGEYPEMTLDLIGSGTRDDLDAVRKLVTNHGLTESVTIVGALDHDDLIARLPAYRALVLPSHNETFGMVYTEALFAGVPVLFSKGTGIDGYLDGLHVGVGVNPKSVDDIASALVTLWQDSDHFRQTIEASAPDIFDTFDPQTHLDAYARDVFALTKTRANDAANRSDGSDA
ncbi:MAG: glycosyltransferase, partial [Pseudomonadota bacterium]